MEKRNKYQRDQHVDVVLDWLVHLREEQTRKRSEDHSVKDREWGDLAQLKKTAMLLGCFQIFLIILFACVGGSEVLDPSTAPGTGTQGYNMFIGVEVMMFVGFGYLMTFLKWYGMGAVAFTMLITALGLQWSLFTESLFAQLMSDHTHWHLVDINIYSLLNTLYAISAVLISFGALIGKISPFQLVTMVIIELVLHSINFKVLMNGCLGLTDMGGTYTDHMFGAYFGLAVSLMLGKPDMEPEMGNTSDIFSFIGTVFLWIYWPSFVAGAAPADSDQQQRAIVNTILALSASTIVTFIATFFLSHCRRFRPVDIQNATLAGGVAIGCTGNLSLSAFGAIMIGATAGLVSTVGYNILQPILQERFGLHDTCGVHNLHAMPSVIGGLASVILAGYKESNNMHDADIYGSSYPGAWWRQLVAIFVCVMFAVGTGTLVGLFLSFIGQENRPTQGSYEFKHFHDNSWWEVADDYGRSLYSELAHSIPDALDRNSVKEHAMKSVHEYSSHHGRRNIISSLHGVSAHNRSRHGTSRDALSGMVEGEESRRVRVLTTTATATTTTTTPAASSRSGDIVGQGQGKDLTTITEEEGEYGHAGEQRV